MKRAARKVKKPVELGIQDWKTAAISLLLLLLFILLVYYNTFSNIKLYIDDTDPYSYEAVILPMFFITLIFFYRNDLKVDRDKNKILLALPFFLVSIIMLYESSAYPQYSLTQLSIPFFTAGCLLLFFSIYAARKLVFLVLYLFLFWTTLFQPLVSTQKSITDFTTDVVSVPLNLLGFNIRRIGDIFYSESKLSLEVVNECVPLSVLFALFCFLLPFAYVAKGAVKNRLAWLVAWIFGGWVLDVLRIISVLVIWYYSGVTNALLVFHALGGNIIFDLTLILALLSIRLFGIDFKL